MRSPVPSGATVGPEPGTQVDRKALSVRPIPPEHSYHPASFANASALRAGSVYTSAWWAMALLDGRTSMPSTQRSVVLPGRPRHRQTRPPARCSRRSRPVARRGGPRRVPARWRPKAPRLARPGARRPRAPMGPVPFSCPVSVMFRLEPPSATKTTLSPRQRSTHATCEALAISFQSTFSFDSNRYAPSRSAVVRNTALTVPAGASATRAAMRTSRFRRRASPTSACPNRSTAQLCRSIACSGEHRSPVGAGEARCD